MGKQKKVLAIKTICIR